MIDFFQRVECRCLQSYTEAAENWRGEMLRLESYIHFGFFVDCCWYKHTVNDVNILHDNEWARKSTKLAPEAIYWIQVPGGLSDFIRRLDGRLKENTVSEAHQLMLAPFTLFFQGETWRRSGWNSVEWWGLLHHHQSWVNFALPACYCYSSFGSSSGRNAIQTHNAVFM